MREMSADDKYYARTGRDQQVRGNAPTPSDMSVDGRRQAMDKADAEARTLRTDASKGYNYQALFTNNGDKTVAVIYWEYRFSELAHPANVVRRQFLCSAKIKPGAKKELWAFSLMGPSDVISIDDLAKATDRVFDEKVLIDRIEFADDTVLQRGGWKLDDVKKSVDLATSTPWGNEVCRSL
jgi:hypothetical protein